MIIPSKFIHLGHFYNWGDLALPHLVTPCIIRMAFLPGGGVLPYQSGGVCRQSPMEHMEKEREIKKFLVTKRELLNNLSNMYKCKVSPGGTFSLGHFLFDERENCQV